LLAAAGEFDAAYEAIADAHAVDDDPADLLLAADVARLSHHPAFAVELLRRVRSSHADDPRAALAAFTLGRILLDDLGRPHEAADAFADAQRGGGPLEEDALARETEAAWRAGDLDRARDRAERYLGAYPSGSRRQWVRRYGGIE
jgi:transmembrane sensor